MIIQPLVSVVIPCYNHENFVKDCIQSVIDQTYENIELIIIDDGSNDSSLAKIREMMHLCEKRFKKFEFRHRSNKGLSATLNEAIEWCQGEYFAALASDDQMINYKIEKQVEYFQNNRNCIACFGGYILINDQDKIISKSKKEQRDYGFDDILLHKHDLPAPTQMILMEKLRQIGGYASNVIIEDWYMWLKLAKIGQLHYMSEYLAKYRSHPDNISKKVELMNVGRMQVLSFYDQEPLYKNALLECNWIYLAELKKNSLYYFLKKFIFFGLFNPNFVIKKLKLMDRSSKYRKSNVD